jgi:hypothetical protein
MSVRCVALSLALALAFCLGASSAAAGAPGGESRPFWRCDPARWSGWKGVFVPSGVWGGEGSSWNKLRRTALHRDDLYNGVIVGLGAWGLASATDPPDEPRWTGGILFDDDARAALRAESIQARESAAKASDWVGNVVLLAPLLVDPMAMWFRNGDCDQSIDMVTDWIESYAWTTLLTEATKIVSARERPFGQECDLDPSYSSKCDASSRNRSFFSGHASAAATGAGLLCANAIEREVWGRGRFEKSVACGLGIAAAAATGLLRVSADKHWLTDVIVGWTVGGLVGYFDLPGPVDLLRIRLGGNERRARVEGAILPMVGRGSAGARLMLRF